MTDYAWIENEHFWNEEEQRMIDHYRWVGTSRLAKIHPPCRSFYEDQAALENDKLAIGDFRLRVVDIEGMYWIVTFDRWYAPIYKIIYRLIRTGEVCRSFIVFILAIWGLAEFHPASIPSWSDVKIIKRFMK